jgi:hypothetical protein
MMPAGKYFVGDLCYVLRGEDWENVCKLIFQFDGSCLQGEFNLPDGRRFAMFNTAFGDGTYEDQDRNSYDVDSGSIGCTLVSNFSSNEDLSKLGRVVEFKEPFEVFSDHGMICFGHVHIETNDTYDDRYDDDVFEEWDED